MSLTSEIRRMSVEPAKHKLDQNMSLDRKIIWYKTRIVGETIYENKLVKKLTMEMCYGATRTNRNSIYILINIHLEGRN